MIENEKNEMRETEAALALTVVLINFLLLAVLGAGFWFVFFVIRKITRLTQSFTADFCRKNFTK